MDEQEEYEGKVKGEGREKKLKKKKSLMRVNSRGLKSIVLPLWEKEAKQKTDFTRARVTIRQSKSYSFS